MRRTLIVLLTALAASLIWLAPPAHSAPISWQSIYYSTIVGRAGYARGYETADEARSAAYSYCNVADCREAVTTTQYASLAVYRYNSGALVDLSGLVWWYGGMGQTAYLAELDALAHNGGGHIVVTVAPQLPIAM